jgi:hypothetical protein
MADKQETTEEKVARVTAERMKSHNRAEGRAHLSAARTQLQRAHQLFVDSGDHMAASVVEGLEGIAIAVLANTPKT